MKEERKNVNNLTQGSLGDNNKGGLTDFDICELYIKCVEVFAQTSSRLEMERHTPLTLGKELWKETIKTLKEYREG